MRVVVFGASGVQGAHQVPVLARAGHTVVAVSRSPKPLLIDGKPIETAAADFSDTEGIQKVVSGADVLFVNLPSTSFNESEPILAATRLIGQAAKKHDVGLIVFNTSMPVPVEVQGIKAQDDRREMRQILRDSGVPTISIEPVVYLDNLLEGWALPPIRDRYTVVYCHKPTLEVSWICHHDVAQLMLAAATRPHLAGRNFPVGGPETVRLEQLAGKLSRAWGRELGFENQTVKDFCEKIGKTMEGRGLEVERIKSQMFKAYTYYNEAEDEPFRIDMGPVLEVLPVRLTGIEEWAGMRKMYSENGYFKYS
ncbi:NAD(P)-binding protein [Amniculicola lignicola CBS 123094]|uniref:NAD(P)-binding protein n=1 Tax=Amniculicola lignicola CBS 123094 TaxID=1392246 RepID=A0A6A5WN64_9PLEO|nr:NAD(P)-binding protein [Amniculicola lignicola CBS 123094]